MSADRERRALRSVRRAYECAHLLSALRGVGLAVVIAALAFGLHLMSEAAWLFAAGLGAALGGFGWRGGAWRRGALAGVLAGLPPLIAPSLMFAVTHGGHCSMCAEDAALPCLITCFATSSLVGLLVGHRAVSEASRRFAIAAIATAALTGLLSCGTTGLGGALGVVIGLVAGGVTGWIVAVRAAHA